MSFELFAIGTITTPYTSLGQCPFNVNDTEGPLCDLIVKDEYAEGITGLNVGQTIDILYWLEGARRCVMLDKPHGRSAGDQLMGTFSLRTPFRPNPIGLAKLTIVAINGSKIQVKGLDCLNGTLLLDIKPAIV